MKSRLSLTPDQIKMLEGMAAIRLPNEQIARILGVSRETFEKHLKRNKAARLALEKGKAQGSQKVHQTAFQLATGYTRQYEQEWFNPKTKQWETRIAREVVPPDPKMLQFWLKTQEKWRETDRLELTGPDGAPLKVTELPRETRQEKLRQYLELFARIEHSKTLVKLDEVVASEATIEVKGVEVDGEES